MGRNDGYVRCLLCQLGSSKAYSRHKGGEKDSHLRLYTRNWSALTGLKNTRTFSAGVKYALKTSKIRMRCTVRFNKNTSMLDVLDMYLCVTNVISQNFQSIDTSMRNYQPRITMNTIFKNTIL